MISVFLREQRRYTQDELVNLLQCTEEKAVRILRRLKEYGVLKAVRADDTQRSLTDLVDDDVEIADVEIGENEYLYVLRLLVLSPSRGVCLSATLNTFPMPQILNQL